MKEFTEKKPDSEAASTQGILASKPFAFYIRLMRWPLLTAIALEMILLALSQKEVYLWFINLLLFIFLALWAYKIYQLKLGQVITLGSVCGFILGLMISLFRLVWFHKLYLFFNIITETIITLLAGFLISGATFLIITKEYRKNTGKGLKNK